MKTPATLPPLPSDERVPSPERTLRRLFLTLFLRGRSARGLQKQRAPRSVAEKLALTLLFYALVGALALTLARQPVFALIVYLHGMTFAFVGLFVASSAGEILFNKEEADILLHRPIEPKALLWAKVRVLVEVSLWLSCAFNLVGFFVGVAAANGGWRFPIVHFVSTTLEATFCVGCVIMVYQLCLRWLGRERLEGLMTAAQVVVSVAAVLAGQLLPQVVFRLNAVADVGATAWWVGLLPPAWFAGFDDAWAGSGATQSWLFAALAALATATVLWLAFGKLAHDYEMGLQLLNEASTRRVPTQAGRRWLDALIDRPPLRWWLRDPVTRASFLLTAAYLVRDRDVKLRIYPGMAPILIVPIVFLMPGFGGRDLRSGGFGLTFAGAYVGLVPLLGLSMLQYSQHWQAADIFRAAPLPGPARLCDGARRAVLCFLTLPLLAVFIPLALLLTRDPSQLLLLLPGVIALPVYALAPNLGGKGVPLSLPVDEAKSAGRGLSMIAVMVASFILAGLASVAWWTGWFLWLIVGETIVAIALHSIMRLSLTSARWTAME